MNYVMAVSGGVDSVVLLDALANSRLAELTIHDSRFTTDDLIVAHFDHGIRSDSAEDAEWVSGLAAKYQLKFISERAELGVNTSEAKAREARYNFLRRCCSKYEAQLVTAHHQDDVLETMLINLIRGTGWRGLAPMSQISDLRLQTSDNKQTLRPLLNVGKAQILQYAMKHGLEWREDSTNVDETYLRNYIRQTLLPIMIKRDPAAIEKLLTINSQMTELKKEIATELQKILTTTHYSLNTNPQLPRYFLIMTPPLVAQEILYQVLTQLDPNWHPNRLALQRLLHFIKTRPGGAVYELTKTIHISLTISQVQFKKV